MEYLSSDVEKLLDECREVLLGGEKEYELLAQEYARLQTELEKIKVAINGLPQETREEVLSRIDAAVPRFNTEPDLPALWREECLAMQKSLSWRITAPLRMIKKIVQSIKSDGFVRTMKKIRSKLTGRA